MAGPFLKWAGGKRTLLGEIESRLPADTSQLVLVEPMAGGGAVSLGLGHRFAGLVIGDVNVGLMAAYTTIAAGGDRLEGMKAKLRSFGRSEDAYYALRSRFNEVKRKIGAWPGAAQSSHVDELAALMLHLNRAGYNGLYRENAKGEMNVPWGRDYDLDHDLEAIDQASAALGGAQIAPGDAIDCISGLGAGSLVYLDPPYVTSSSKSFTSYSGRFGATELAGLSEAAKVAHEKGAMFVVSQPDSAVAHTAWAWMKSKHMVMAPRSVGAGGRTRGSVAEMLLTNY